MFDSPSQLGLNNLPSPRTKKRKEHPWKMDSKTLEERRINIPHVTRLFFSPTKQGYSKHVERL
jgi:hypothetical protein